MAGPVWGALMETGGGKADGFVQPTSIRPTSISAFVIRLDLAVVTRRLAMSHGSGGSEKSASSLQLST
jgi:hypothetical protein